MATGRKYNGYHIEKMADGTYSVWDKDPWEFGPYHESPAKELSKKHSKLLSAKMMVSHFNRKKKLKEEYLTELGDRPRKIMSDNSFRHFKTSEGSRYDIHIFKGGSDDEYELSFDLSYEGRKKKYQDVHPNGIIGNSGAQIEVFSTVAKFALDWLKKNPTKTMKFSSKIDESSRTKLYDVYAKRLAKESGRTLDMYETGTYHKEKVYLFEPIKFNPKVKLKEDGGAVAAAPTNSAGGGAIAGIGVGPKGEPGVNPKQKKKKFTTFLRRKNVLNEVHVPLTHYGYWITDKGEIFPVDNYQHARVARELCPLGATKTGLEAGWVRIVVPMQTSVSMSRKLEFEFDRKQITKKQIMAMKSIIHHYSYANKFYFDSWRHGSDHEFKEFETGAEAIRYCNQLITASTPIHEEYLIEMGDKVLPYELEADRHYVTYYTFSVNDKENSRIHVNMEKQNDNGNEWKLNFARFSETIKPENSMGITNKGNAFEIFSTIGKIVLDWLTKYPERGLFFSAKEQSRKKLYNKLVDYIAHKTGRAIKKYENQGAYWIYPIGQAAPKQTLKIRNPMVAEDSFAGQKVFTVDSERFHKARLGKRAHERFAKYVGDDDIGEEIRQFGRTNPGTAIILQHEGHGGMMYLRYGRKR